MQFRDRVAALEAVGVALDGDDVRVVDEPSSMAAAIGLSLTTSSQGPKGDAVHEFAHVVRNVSVSAGRYLLEIEHTRAERGMWTCCPRFHPPRSPGNTSPRDQERDAPAEAGLRHSLSVPRGWGFTCLIPTTNQHMPVRPLIFRWARRKNKLRRHRQPYHSGGYAIAARQSELQTQRCTLQPRTVTVRAPGTTVPVGSTRLTLALSLSFPVDELHVLAPGQTYTLR